MTAPPDRLPPRRGGGSSPYAYSSLLSRLPRAAALFAASLVIVPPASAEDVTIWSAELEVKTLNAAQDELGCSDSGPFNGQCGNSNVLSDDDFSLHGNPYTITRIEDDGSELELTLDTALPSNVLEFLTLHVGDDTELAFEDARVSSNSRRYTWSSSPSWSLGDDVDLSITDSSGPSLVKNTSLDDNERNLFENGHRSAQAFTAGTWARVTLIGIGIGDEVDDDVDVTLHKGGGSNPGDRLKRLSNPSSITADSVNVFTVPDGGIVLEASKTYFVQVKTTSSDRVAVSVTGPLSGGNAEDDGAAENWTIDNDSWTNRPSIGTWQASNQSMRIDVKGQVLLAPPENVTARAVAPMRVTLDWNRTLPSPKIIDRDDGYKIQWSPDGSTSWTSLVNYTNNYGTFDIWCTCYPTRYNDDTIAPGTTRHYRIKAVDDDDESAWSDVVSATTPGLVDSDGGRIDFGAVVSELDALNDQKGFRIDLQASEKYRFMIQGKAPKHRVIVTDEGGTEIENFVLVGNNTLLPRITAQTSGEHQVKISHGGRFSSAGYGSLNAGWFQFQLVPVSDPAVGTLRLPTPSALDAVLSTYGDVDRAKLAVQPGKAYAVRGRGRETAGGTAATPRIKRARPPSTNHEYNMGKPWVDGVTIAKVSPLCHNFSEPEKCEFQAFVIDLRGQTGAEQTWQIIVAPTARPRTWPYPVGTYRVELKELLPSQLAGVRMPLRAWVASQPPQHDGLKAIKVRVGFSDAVENMGRHGVRVEGGEVTSVRAVGGSASAGAGTRSAGGRNAGQEDREVVWEFEIEPDSYGDVTVALEAWRPCEETGAICTADGRVLSQGISTTVRGPVAGAQDPLTARFEGMPKTHDGESAFTFRVAFSEDIGISFRALREDAFTVTGGTVTGGRRVDDRRDLFVMTVQPDAEGDVTITLEVGRDCATSGAICTKGENRRRLTNSLSATVAGPAAALTASFEGLPAEHRGEGGFHFRVAFSEDIGISFRALREDAFTVTGGRVTGGKRVDGRRDLFRMTVRPDADGDVTITLPAGRACAVSGAICTKGENRRQLTNTPSATVRGPASGMDFAHFAKGATIASEMVLVNAAPHPSRPAIYFYDTKGDPIPAESVVDLTGDLEVTEDGALTVRTEMEPLAELTISTHGRGEPVSGSVTVLSDGPIGGVVRYSVSEIGVAGVGPGQPTSDALFPVRRQAGGIRTAAALHNLEAEAMGVNCRLMRGGVALEEVEIHLEANGQTSWFIEDTFTATDTSDFLGSVRCTAPGNGRFTAVALEMDPGNRIFTTLPVVPVDPPGSGNQQTTLDFAHFANGTGITSEMVFLNPSTQPSRPAVYFYDTEGNPIAPDSVVDVTGDLEITEDGALTVQTEMEPLGELTISTHGRGELVTGSVRVVSDGPLGGLLRFDLPGVGAGVVGASPPLSDALFPVRRQEGGINTWAAIHNLESSPELVRCELRKEGLLLDAASIPLDANGQTSWFIDAAFPDTDTSGFSGSVRCTATGEGLFTAVALELDAGNRIFTTLPVVPVPERMPPE